MILSAKYSLICCSQEIPSDVAQIQPLSVVHVRVSSWVGWLLVRLHVSVLVACLVVFLLSFHWCIGYDAEIYFCFDYGTEIFNVSMESLLIMIGLYLQCH